MTTWKFQVIWIIRLWIDFKRKRLKTIFKKFSLKMTVTNNIISQTSWTLLWTPRLAYTTTIENSWLSIIRNLVNCFLKNIPNLTSNTNVFNIVAVHWSKAKVRCSFNEHLIHLNVFPSSVPKRISKIKLKFFSLPSNFHEYNLELSPATKENIYSTSIVIHITSRWVSLI